jgi:hypothetical protein
MKAKLLSTLAAFPLAAAALTTGVQSASALTFDPPVGGDTLDFGFSVNAAFSMTNLGMLEVDFFQPVGAICTGIAGLPDDNCATMGPSDSDNGAGTGFFSPFDGLVASIVDKVEIDPNGPTNFAPDIDPFFVYDLAAFGGEEDDKFIAESASQPLFTQDGDDALFSINVFGTIVDENGNTYKSRLVIGATFQNMKVEDIIEMLDNGDSITSALDAQQDLVVQNVPEPSAMLGLAAVLGAGFFAKKRKDS